MKVNVKRIALAIAACGALSGCVRHYALPESAPKAVLNLSTTMNGVRVQAYSDDKCTRSPHGNRLAYFFMSVADPLTGVDKQIPASEEFVYTHAFSSQYSVTTSGATFTGGGACSVTVGFKPVAGARYKSTFTREGNRCVVNVSRVVNTQAGERFAPEETLRKIEPPCVNNLTD